MTLTKEQIELFKIAATPLIAFLNELPDPPTVIIDAGSAELFERSTRIVFDQFLYE